MIAALDESFFRVRFDRLTPSQKRYLRAMAALGPGPHRSGDVADMLQKKVTSLGPIRNQLINKGMIWSPSHGDTAFTVPMFDAFMRRIMSGEDWRSEWCPSAWRVISEVRSLSRGVCGVSRKPPATLEPVTAFVYYCSHGKQTRGIESWQF